MSTVEESLQALRVAVEQLSRSVADGPRLYSLREAGERLGGVSEKTIRRRVAMGELSAVEWAGKSYVSSEEIRRIATMRLIRGGGETSAKPKSRRVAPGYSAAREAEAIKAMLRRR